MLPENRRTPPPSPSPEQSGRDGEGGGRGRVRSITGTNFEPGYFERQLAKSDAKLRWQYDRMFGFAGVRLPIGARALDVGCGAAPGLRYLRRRGIVAYGCDVSAAALAAARQAMPDAQLVRCDLDRGLPFASGQFDLVLMSEIVEHVADPALVLAEIR